MAAFSAYGRMASPISATYNSQLNRSALGLGQNGLGVRQDRSAMTSPYGGVRRQGSSLVGTRSEGMVKDPITGQTSYRPAQPSQPSLPGQPVRGGAMNMNQYEPQGRGGAMNMNQYEPQGRGGNPMNPVQYGAPMQNYLNQMALMRGQMPQMQQQQMPMFRAF
jgi:hypothetical protein